jgi:hypothetical protein
LGYTKKQEAGFMSKPVGSKPTSGSGQAGGIYRDMDKTLASNMQAVASEYAQDAADTRAMGYPEKPFSSGSNLASIQKKFGPGAGVD